MKKNARLNMRRYVKLRLRQRHYVTRNKCELVHEEKCFDVPHMEDCKIVQKPVTKHKDEQKCETVTEQQCKPVVEECKTVTETECTTTHEKVCNTVTEKV